MRAVKTTFVACTVFGLVCGSVFGYKHAIRSSESMRDGCVSATESVLSDFAREQFMHADNAHARQAVLLQIGTLQLLERAEHDPHRWGELGYAFTRLGMIEKASGSSEASAGALNEAKAWFKRARPHEDLSDEQIETALSRRDGALDVIP